MKKELRHKIIYFQILCILLFFISVPILLWMLNIPSSNREKNSVEYSWQNAVDIVPQPLLTQVLSFLSKTKIDKKSIKVLKIPSTGAGILFIFDFRSSQLCGVGGCLYEVYHESGEGLLQVIAKEQLPPSQQLIKVQNDTNEPFPCINLFQQTTMKYMISENKYCFDTGRYTYFYETWTTINQ
ncbi:MAG: histidine kinase [Richelia sp. RM2_1_2]|nr:histidine kinase [Richelia sp. RM2_1_2]